MKLRIVLKPLAAIVVILTLWHIASSFIGSIFLPSPLKVASSLLLIITKPAAGIHVATTFTRVLAGVALGSILGLAMGIVPRYSSTATFFVTSILKPIFASIPALCWALIFASIFGLSGVAPALVVAVSIAPFFIVNLSEGLKELDEGLVEMAHAFTESKLKVLKAVVLPLLYPYLFASLRTSFEVAWKVVLMGEVFGAVEGVGYMVWLSFSLLRIDYMLAWVLIAAAIIASFEYGIFNFLDKRFMRRWRK